MSNQLFSNEFRENYSQVLQEIEQYIESTYSKHYVSNNGLTQMQTVDMWEHIGNLDTTLVANAIKYLTRFGRKEGRNQADILKAIHYLTMLYFWNQREHMKNEGQRA